MSYYKFINVQLENEHVIHYQKHSLEEAINEKMITL